MTERIHHLPDGRSLRFADLGALTDAAEAELRTQGRDGDARGAAAFCPRVGRIAQPQTHPSLRISYNPRAQDLQYGRALPADNQSLLTHYRAL